MSPERGPNNESTTFAKFEIWGRFTPQFVSSSLMDWFSMPNGHENDPRLRLFQEPVEPWTENVGVEEELGIWIPPDQPGDIHGIVREAFLTSESKGYKMEFAGLTLEQIARLRDDWDGRGAPAPSVEIMQWARIALQNMSLAADAVGIGFRKPLTQLFSIQPTDHGPPDIFIAIRCLLWSNLLMLYLRTTPDKLQAWGSLEFDVHLEEQSRKGWLTMELSVLRKDGESPGETLSKVLWWDDAARHE